MARGEGGVVSSRPLPSYFRTGTIPNPRIFNGNPRIFNGIVFVVADSAIPTNLTESALLQSRLHRTGQVACFDVKHLAGKS